MQTDRSAQRIAAFSLGTAAIFDMTGAVIYRVLRGALPAPPPESGAGVFQESAAMIREAHREAVTHARGRGGASHPA
jgi:hypothetical protein